MWVRSPWIDLHPYLQLAEPYWIQLEGFYELLDGTPAPMGPGLRCIQVESRPVAIAQLSWGNVKYLYQ